VVEGLEELEEVVELAELEELAEVVEVAVFLRLSSHRKPAYRRTARGFASSATTRCSSTRQTPTLGLPPSSRHTPSAASGLA
jgi:hypothetical protein